MARPRFDDRFNHVPLFVWVLVELTRDRNNVNTTRHSVRAACRRLEKKLEADFKGGRVLPWETIRRYHKDFETTVRKSNSSEQLAEAKSLLAIGRERREFLGWDASVWLFVAEPEFLIALGGRYSEPKGL